MLNKKFAIVVSQFNTVICEKLLEGALDTLIASNVSQKNIKVVKVPGAIEIPLVSKLLAKSEQYASIICLGVVIRGDTSHYDYVCQQVSNGCMQVMLEFELPIVFGVLTTENEAQALERVGGSEGHKGSEAAAVALFMSALTSELSLSLK